MNEETKKRLSNLQSLSNDLEALRGQVADDTVDASLEPLRAEARLLVLKIIDNALTHIGQLTDCLLDGAIPTPKIRAYLAEIKTVLRMLRPTPPVHWPEWEATAALIENDRRLFETAMELDPPPQTAKLLRAWLRDSAKALARLKAGRLYDLDEVADLSERAKHIKRLAV